MLNEKELVAHQSALHELFQTEGWEAARKELEMYKQNLIMYMAYNKYNEAEFYRSQGNLEVVDIWLELPGQIEKYVKKMKDFVTSLRK